MVTYAQLRARLTADYRRGLLTTTEYARIMDWIDYTEQHMS